MHNDVADWFNRMWYDIVSPVIYSSTKDDMENADSLQGVEKLNDQTYYAISKAIVKDVIPIERAANKTIYFTG